MWGTPPPCRVPQNALAFLYSPAQSEPLASGKERHVVRISTKLEASFSWLAHKDTAPSSSHPLLGTRGLTEEQNTLWPGKECVFSVNGCISPTAPLLFYQRSRLGRSKRRRRDRFPGGIHLLRLHLFHGWLLPWCPGSGVPILLCGATQRMGGLGRYSFWVVAGQWSWISRSGWADICPERNMSEKQMGKTEMKCFNNYARFNSITQKFMSTWNPKTVTLFENRVSIHLIS